MFLIAAAALSPAASAAEFKDMALPLPVMIDQFSRQPFAGLPVPSRAADLITAGETALYWTYVYRETFATGVATFEYKKEQYAIKPLFMKGQYNEAKGNYIAVPLISIMKVTNADKEVKLEAWMDISGPVESSFTTASGDKLKIKNDAGAISILSKGIFSEKTVFSVTHDQIFKLWADNAEKYKRTVHGKVVYLVPQMSWAKGSITQVGFVASEGKPLIGATGRPLDYIALCQAKDGVTCSPLRYSIPLGLKFRYLGKEGGDSDKDFFYWQIEEMVNDDLYDALDDEALQVSINPAQ